jgi:outer membrane lipoprotein-sorting protein
MGESTIWVADKINFPIKIYSKNPKDTVTVMYSNIKEGPVEDSLFSIPPDYQKMDFGVSG